MLQASANNRSVYKSSQLSKQNDGKLLQFAGINCNRHLCTPCTPFFNKTRSTQCTVKHVSPVHYRKGCQFFCYDYNTIRVFPNCKAAFQRDRETKSKRCKYVSYLQLELCEQQAYINSASKHDNQMN
jgi:hypothetical protein